MVNQKIKELEKKMKHYKALARRQPASRAAQRMRYNGLAFQTFIKIQKLRHK
jgi:hypothetical protein